MNFKETGVQNIHHITSLWTTPMAYLRSAEQMKKAET